MLLNEITEQINDFIDNKNGWGAVSLNQEIDYFGFKVMMKPSKFLELSAKMGIRQDNVDTIITHLKNGGTIASPFLKIEMPDEWLDGDFSGGNAKVVRYGHEGRHRMHAVMKLFGDDPIEVHIKPTAVGREVRARHLNDSIIAQLQKGILSEGDENYIENTFVRAI